VHGRAIGGFAVVAYPAKYGSSGIMTFIVNQDGRYSSPTSPQHSGQGRGDAEVRPGPAGRPSRRNDARGTTQFSTTKAHLMNKLVLAAALSLALAVSANAQTGGPSSAPHRARPSWRRP